MQKLASAQFRTSYVVLTEPTEVHAGRRTLGTWYPAGTEPTSAPKAPATAPEAPKPAPTTAPKPAPKARSTRAGAQATRDGWLKKASGSTS
jgi:hypothetical protein